MKSVLISIQPKWVEKIANGEKTIEVRKTKPKLETPFKCYIYETKGYDTLFGKGKPKKLCVCGGRVIGEFVCDSIEKIKYNPSYYFMRFGACLEPYEVWKYDKGKPLYAWHISDLKIYDKPKELSEFKTVCLGELHKCDNCFYYYYENTEDGGYEECCCNNLKPLSRPPQSWCYVESLGE